LLEGYKAVITAGGIGTRLLPFSKEIPKEMAPMMTRDSNEAVQVKPVIQAIYEQLYRSGVRDFFIVVGRGKRAIQDHFTPDQGFVEMLDRRGKSSNGLTEFYGMLRSSNMTFVVQPEPRGFGDAVSRASPYITGGFVVHAGDTYVISKGDSFLERLTAARTRHSADATILLQDVDDPRQYGVVDGKELGGGVVEIREAVEKPEKPKTRTAIMPVYLFDRSIFDELAKVKPGKGGEVQLTDAIQSLASSGRKVVGVKLRKDELRLDIGSPETMIEALRLSSGSLEVAGRRGTGRALVKG
jgi:UTP--glucose-1-phosphate uridylyltransferase